MSYHLEKSWALQVHCYINGGFYKLRVKRRLIYKCFSYIGIKEWCIDAGVTALGSAAQAMEGHHYYRCMHLHKELFDKLVQFRFEKLKGYLFFSKFWRSTSRSRQGMKLKFGQAIPLVKWWQLVVLRDWSVICRTETELWWWY